MPDIEPQSLHQWFPYNNSLEMYMATAERPLDELATMRLLEDDWGEECLRKYHECIPKSAPEEDWDARNALYSM